MGGIFNEICVCIILARHVESLAERIPLSRLAR
jgi:hypothetical protein